ncbi:ribosomal S7-like protein [Vibrio vulnificus]|nr:ribosomal S7-like protein [Vibrio vulnificus]
MRQETELRHSHINTQHTTTTSPAVVPVHTGNHLSAIAVCRVGNTLTAKNNKNNDNAVVIPTHYTRYTMGPRVREDDEIRDGNKKPSEDQRQRTKNLNTAATPPVVIPVHTGNYSSASTVCRVGKYTYRNKQQEQRQYSSNTYPLHSPYHRSPRSRG